MVGFKTYIFQGEFDCLAGIFSFYSDYGRLKYKVGQLAMDPPAALIFYGDIELGLFYSKPPYAPTLI